MMNSYENTNPCCEKRVCCGLIPVIVFALLFTVVLGLILGAVFATFFLANLVAFIILAVLLFVLAAVSWLVIRCSCKNRRSRCDD